MINYKKRNKWQSYPAGWAVFHQCTENYIKSKQTPEIHEYLKGNFAIKCRGAFWNFKRPDFKKQKCVFGWNQKERTEVSHSYPKPYVSPALKTYTDWPRVAQCHPSRSKVWFERPSRGLITQSDCESAWPIPCVRSFWWRREVSWWLQRVFPQLRMLWRGRRAESSWFIAITLFTRRMVQNSYRENNASTNQVKGDCGEKKSP